MPRNGAGIYSLPPTYEAVDGETAIAEQHNDPLEDLENDANTARPLVAGGTGQTTAIGAIDAFSTKGSAIASGTTTNLATASGDFVHITGTTTITGLGTATAGVERDVVFDASLTLTHNGTSLILPGAANIITAAGDTARFRSEGSGNWRLIAYQRANGSPLLNAGTTMTLTYVDAGAAIGPTIDLFRDSASPAASDVMASIDFNGRDSAANKQLYARLYSTIRVATSGSEDGEFRIAATVSGSLTDVYVYSQGTHALTGALTVSSTTYLAGVTRIGQNSVDDPGQGNANTGVGISSSQIWVANNASSGTAVLGVGRGNSVPDGTLVSFTRGGTSQGSISVSSTVVSYNTFMGAHDSRLWSARLAEWQDKFIPRGSILSSVNEMVNWLAVEYVDHAGEKHQNEALIEERGLSLGDTTIVHLTRRETEEYEDFDISTIIGENGGSVEVQIPITRTREVVVEYDVEGIAVALANDQLPAFMVSEIEDDERVYGVMAWQTGPLDYNVSALGAYLVRVHRDEVQTVIDTLALPGKCALISSRGDGTGKVQRDRNGDIDDVFRMRTVAKVTAAIRRPVNFAGDLAYEDGSVLLPASIHCG